MRRDDTKARVLEAGRDLLETEGAEAMSMRRVAGAVGITAMAIYRHFADRDALLQAIADEGFAGLAVRLRRSVIKGGPLEERMTRVLDVNIDLALERPRLFELMFLRPRKGARRFPEDFEAGKSPTANVFTELGREAAAAGWWPQEVVWELTFESGALLQGLVMLYLGGRMTGGPAKFRKVCHRALERYTLGARCETTKHQGKRSK